MDLKCCVLLLKLYVVRGHKQEINKSINHIPPEYGDPLRTFLSCNLITFEAANDHCHPGV